MSKILKYSFVIAFLSDEEIFFGIQKEDAQLKEVPEIIWFPEIFSSMNWMDIFACNNNVIGVRKTSFQFTRKCNRRVLLLLHHVPNLCDYNYVLHSWRKGPIPQRHRIRRNQLPQKQMTKVLTMSSASKMQLSCTKVHLVRFCKLGWSAGIYTHDVSKLCRRNRFYNYAKETLYF